MTLVPSFESGVALSPYRRFTRADWAQLRADTPLTLTIDDLSRVKSLGDPISLEEDSTFWVTSVAFVVRFIFEYNLEIFSLIITNIMNY